MFCSAYKTYSALYLRYLILNKAKPQRLKRMSTFLREWELLWGFHRNRITEHYESEL